MCDLQDQQIDVLVKGIDFRYRETIKLLEISNTRLMVKASNFEYALDNIVGSGAQHEETCDTAEHDELSGCIWCEARRILKEAR